MLIKDIFEKAYQLMDEPIIEGNCGELCNYHCCRSHEKDEHLGMYLFPGEFEVMQQAFHTDFEVHSSYQYKMPKGTKKLYYIFCIDDTTCLRNHRPIQCRTYPFEPHIRNGVLSLVIEQDQLHACPLIHKMASFRPAFVHGIYKGWRCLLEIEAIRTYLLELSRIRDEEANICYELTEEMINEQWIP